MENPWYIDDWIAELMHPEAKNAKEELDNSTPQTVDSRLIEMGEKFNLDVKSYQETGLLYDSNWELVYQHWSVDDMSGLSDTELNLENDLLDAYDSDFIWPPVALRD